MQKLAKVDKMQVLVSDSNEALGKAAADDFTEIVKQIVAERGEIAIIFATGNAQLSFLKALRDKTDIPWNKVTAFHMDEYLGITDQHPASFQRFIREKITDVFHPRETYGMRGDAPNADAEIARYTELLEKYQPALCVLGIGENGHIAFNDPPADFHTAKTVHVVNLDEACRRQQVGEGHFASIDQVPRQALSLTVPALLKVPRLMAIVPEARKANAVKAALNGPVSEMCPASILRTHSNVKLYLDRDSAALVEFSG